MKQSLRHFRLNKWREASAQRRGGQTCHIPLEASGAHGAGDDIQSVASDFADQSFDRAYAGEIVSRALTRLAEEYASLSKGALFNALSPHLVDRVDRGEHAVLAQQLGMSQAALRTALSRLRSRFRELLVEEVLPTVRDSSEAIEELRHLLAAWTRTDEAGRFDSSIGNCS